MAELLVELPVLRLALLSTVSCLMTLGAYLLASFSVKGEAVPTHVTFWE